MPCQRSTSNQTSIRRLDRLSRWFFWILWASIVLIAAAFYYEKAADNRSAFVRWRPQVLQFWAGVNIYDKMIFPNPPIMPITLYPLMVLPTVAGAMCWFAIKVALTTADSDHVSADRAAAGPFAAADVSVAHLASLACVRFWGISITAITTS